MPPDAPKTLTMLDVARLLNIMRHGVQIAITRGRMQAVKRGGHWFVTIAEIERYRVFHLHGQDSDCALSNSAPRRTRHGGG